MSPAPEPVVALLPWGNVAEDFLEPLDLSLEDFAERMTGGWMFGYIEALKLAGWRAEILWVTSRHGPCRLAHRDTGVGITALPAPLPWRCLPRPDWRTRAPWLATPLLGFARELRRLRCRAILCQEYEYGRFDLAVLLGRLLGLPVVATFQGADRPASRGAALVRRLTVPRARGFAVAAEREARRLIDEYGVAASRVRLIPNPLDLRLWPRLDRDLCRQALGLPAAAEIVVSHGRIDRWRKGLDVLLAAWGMVIAARPGRDLQLVLIGGGADEAWLDAELARPPGHGITWRRGYELDRAVMARHLAAADLFALASRLEGQPVAPLEAMAMGLPVIAAATHGMAEIVGPAEEGAGLLVPTEDPAALAAALGRALDDPGWRARAGAAARRRVEAVFSLAAVGRALAELLGPV